MRPWRSATLMAAGIVALCLALTGCGSHQFGSAVTCSSETHCLVVLQSPAENGDPLT